MDAAALLCLPAVAAAAAAVFAWWCRGCAGSVFHKVTLNFLIGHHGTSLSDCSPQNNASSAPLLRNESVEREESGRGSEGKPETNWIPPSLGFISSPISPSCAAIYDPCIMPSNIFFSNFSIPFVPKNVVSCKVFQYSFIFSPTVPASLHNGVFCPLANKTKQVGRPTRFSSARYKGTLMRPLYCENSERGSRVG